ncbi:unnamed protein product, partial [marine sediment metagenome]
SDADIFVVLRVFDTVGKEVVFQGALDPHTPVGQGWLRASHRKLDPKRSLPYRPYHTHDEKQPLKPGQMVELDIEIWPTCIVVPKGYRIALTIRGKDYECEGEPATLSNMKNPMCLIRRRQMKTGFIGLGTMGGWMATSILKAGHTLTVHDLRLEVAKPLLNSGASWADTPRAVAEASEIVFTSLPGPKEVETVAIGKNGIIEGIRPGGVFIDLSTSSPTLARHLYRLFKNKGAHMMDAPVSGGPTGARTGRLAVMVGGDEEIYQQCKPV